MKRALAILLVLCMLLGVLSACGSSSSDTTETSTASEASAEETTTAQEAASESDTAAEPSSDEGSGEVVYQTITDETQAIIDEAVASGGIVSSADYPDEEKSETWQFVESQDFRDALSDLRADIDAVFPTSETKYDENGNILSTQDVVYAYPLDEGHSISCYAVTRALLGNYVSDYNELITYQIASAETGIDVEWLCVSGDAASTQINLMFVSGDMTDLVSDFSYSYSGTIASAYENDQIYSLNDYLEEYSPNYLAWLESDEEYMRAVSDDDGSIFAWYGIQPVVAQEQAGWVRADLLEEFGIDAPVTKEEYEEYFELCKDYGLSAVISAGTYSFTIGSSAWDLPDFAETDGLGPALYHIGDTIYSAYYADNAYDYMCTLHEWYEAGYYYADITSLNGTEAAQNIINELVYSGETGYMSFGAGHYSMYKSMATDENWDVTPVQCMVMEEDDVTHFAQDYVINESNGSIVLTTNCADIEAACRFVDWFYTDMGINTINYGPEGVSWNWSEDGNYREFTSAIYADSVYGLNAGPVMMLYCGGVAWVGVLDCYINMYYADNDVAIEAMNVWATNRDGDYYLDTSVLSFTTEESDIINGNMSDIQTYLEENLVKFLIGARDLETEWDDFIDDITDMGFQEVIDTYQAAYTRYLAR